MKRRVFFSPIADNKYMRANQAAWNFLDLAKAPQEVAESVDDIITTLKSGRNLSIKQVFEATETVSSVVGTGDTTEAVIDSANEITGRK